MATDTATTPIQDQFLESLTTAHDATLKILKGWTKTLSSTPNMNDLFSMPRVDTFYGFAEKVWSAQRDFMVGLLETATEAGKTVPDNVKRTTERATSATTPSGK